MSLKRYKPLKRSKPLQRKGIAVSSRRNPQVSSEEKRKPIPKVSEKTAEKNKIYYQFRNVFLSLFGFCNAQLPGCTRVATDIHHRKGRGKFLLIIRFFLPVCRRCHDKIGVDTKLAIREGLSVYRNRNEEIPYLQPFDIGTIHVLLKTGVKLSITN